MKISGKVFLCIGITTLVTGAMIILYFILLLPGLYVDYKQKAELENVVMIQDGYATGRKMTEMNERGAFFVFVVTLPKEESMIRIDGPFGGVSMEILDTKFSNIVNEIRKDLAGMSFDNSEEVAEEMDFEKYEELFKEITEDTNEIEDMIHIIEAREGDWTQATVDTVKMHQTPEGSVVFYTKMEAHGDQYMNYLGMGEGEDAYYFTLAANVSPKLKELTPILLQSTPMILVILILFSLCVAYFFTKILAGPIKVLAKEATKMKELNEVEAIHLGRSDEFHDLEIALNQLYFHLKGLLEKEKEMNAILKQEQEKQELFMMNASHQLKTPVAASLLLIEGMMQKVGKYKDVEKYLPFVKQELMQMQQLIYTLLDMFKHVYRGLMQEDIEIKNVMQALAGNYQILLQEKSIRLELKLEECRRKSDAEILYAMLDNLFSNAVRYTPKGERIKVFLNQDGFRIENSGIEIAEKVRERIFEPFVSFAGETREGHGLGLYLVSIYGKMLHMDVKIKNGDNCVIVEGRFNEDV